MFHSGLAARRSVTVSLAFDASNSLLLTRTFAARLVVPSIFQSPGANHGRARVSQRAMLPDEWIVTGHAAAASFIATGLVSSASSISSPPLIWRCAASTRVG